MSSEKIRGIEKYYENAPYHENSFASEIHGKKNQHTINETVKGLVDMREKAQHEGNEQLAGACETGVYHINKQCENLQVLKQEHSADLRTRSNWTDHGWDDNFFVKTQDRTTPSGEVIKGDYEGIIDFDKDLNMKLTAFDPTLNKDITKGMEEITSDWESIGDWMAKLENLIIRMEKDPKNFSTNYEVNNLIKNNWRSMISDPDPTLDPNGISKGFRLQQILHEQFAGKSQEEIDGTIASGSWGKRDFDPTHDTRLFASIKNQLESVANPNYLTEKEKLRADELMSNKSTPSSGRQTLKQRLADKLRKSIT